MIGNIKVDGQLTTETINGVSNIVTQAKWYINIVRSDYTLDLRGGIANFDYDPASPFINYADLTEATVIGWITNSLSADELAFWERIEASHVNVTDNDSERRATYINAFATYVPQPVEQDAPW